MTTTAIEEQDRLDMGRLADGHDAALNDLMERHAERLFHYLIRQVQVESDAADLAQETFLRVYQNRSRFNRSAKFSTWLYTIATNLVRDRFRRRSRHPQVSLEAEDEKTGGSLQEALADDKATPGEQLQAEERAATVRNAVARLPEELRTALVLAEYEDLAHAEIADILKCSIKAVESRISRARGQLRARLEKMAEFS